MSKFETFDFSQAIPIVAEDTEFFPLLTQEDEDNMANAEIPEALSILPLRNTVLFPGVVIPITVGRDKSIKLVKEAYKGSKTIGVVSQKDMTVEDPGFEELNKVGTVAHIIKVLQMPDGNTTVIIQGKQRFNLLEIVGTEPYLKARVEKFNEAKPKMTKHFKATISTLKEMALQIIQLSPNLPSEAGIAIKNIESPSFLINFISSNINVEMTKKQELLQIPKVENRAKLLLELLTTEIQMLELKHQIQNKVRVDLDKQQRDYFLNQQLKTIQEELGGNTPDLELEELKKRGKSKKWSLEVEKHFTKELEKLSRINPAAADYSVQLNYLELLLDLPWNDNNKR
ncbi:ATP-dependent Lon protease [Sphingobacterium zeae]|uniref:ATP-dependent Lon protease n=1 Tax=Sphingobacterium zeae TaxID=1776859 RepID=A0ABU0U3E4_9SPHI|nr:ATP-dependent Lon protease [Sphingobacterium zeae]